MDRSDYVSPGDQDTQRAESMKRRLEQRKATMLDPRKRRLGLDLEAIQRQIQDKKEREAREKARNDAFDQMTLDQQELVIANYQREQELRHQVAKDDDNYRHNYQRPEQSREYDIWRPDYLKVSHPTRISDDDPSLGPASGQVFEGEDLQREARLEAQRKQIQEWNAEQVREKQMAKQRDEAENLRDQITQLKTQKMLMELDAQTEAARAAVRAQIAADNRSMAEEKAAREKAEREFILKQNDAELRLNARSRTIVEEMCSRNAGPMEYRGMTIEEQKAIIDEQGRQMEENERRREEEKQREEQWAQYEAYLRAEGDKAEAEYIRKRIQVDQDIARINMEQEKEFKERQRYLNKEVYGKNVPDDSYYSQWGNSIR